MQDTLLIHGFRADTGGCLKEVLSPLGLFYKSILPIRMSMSIYAGSHTSLKEMRTSSAKESHTLSLREIDKWRIEIEREMWVCRTLHGVGMRPSVALLAYMLDASLWSLVSFLGERQRMPRIRI